jgi:hypothetical protein
MIFFHAEHAELWEARSDAVSSHAECAELWEWSPLCADTLRVIKQNEAIQRITSLDCFVVPPRNDAKRRKNGVQQVPTIPTVLRGK